jgi:hypothetical protein
MKEQQIMRELMMKYEIKEAHAVDNGLELV